MAYIVPFLIYVEYRKIIPPRVICAPADGVPLGIGYRRIESKN